MSVRAANDVWRSQSERRRVAVSSCRGTKGAGTGGGEADQELEEKNRETVTEDLKDAQAEAETGSRGSSVSEGIQ